MKLPGFDLHIGTTAEHFVGNLAARQTSNDDGFTNDDFYVPFWYTSTGIIVKWCLFLGLVLLFSAYLLIGYTHAKKRLARGLPPLAYHRWLVSRSQMARVDPRYAYPTPAGVSTYRPPQDEYGMYAMPPPVYDPTAPRPPMYGPPLDGGAAKVDPDQSRAGAGAGAAAGTGTAAATATPYRPPAVTDEYEPPAGPPPSAVRPQGTGNTNPFRD